MTNNELFTLIEELMQEKVNNIDLTGRGINKNEQLRQITEIFNRYRLNSLNLSANNIPNQQDDILVNIRVQELNLTMKEINDLEAIWKLINKSNATLIDLNSSYITTEVIKTIIDRLKETKTRVRSIKLNNLIDPDILNEFAQAWSKSTN